MTHSSTTWGQWTTINFASDDWNKLNYNIRDIKDIDKFKRLLN